MIKFEQTLEDSIAFNDYYLRTHLTFLQKYWRWIVTIILSIYIFKASGQPLNEALLDWGNWVIVGFIGLITFLLTKFASSTKRKTLMTFVKNNPQSVGSRQIDYDEEKVTVTANSSSTDYKYSAFVKVEENENYYFAFTGAQTALILPKRISDNDLLLNWSKKLGQTQSKWVEKNALQHQL